MRTNPAGPVGTTTLPRTEQRHPASGELDAMSSLQILELMNTEDALVADALRPVLPALADLVDHAVTALQAGGAVHYFGAGTSGRLAVLDAAELVPTFALEPGRIVAHLAGGASALLSAVEGAEDSVAAGHAEGEALRPGDIAIGIAASGGTPYVGAALRAARAAGARTALITNNPHASLATVADTVLLADTGPEILTGSTRLKAGTAAKLLLNAFSTAVMVRSGRTWSNLMVSLVASNAKLRDRSVRILVEATGLPTDQAAALLARCDGELKTALVSHLADVPAGIARDALTRCAGSVREALTRVR